MAQDLRAHFWDESARVIANSVGAYLFLHAQAGLPAFPGRVLLLSPIVGGFFDDSLGMGFVPPLAEKLFQLARTGNMPNPQRYEMHVGGLDWQCDSEKVCALCALVGVSATVVPGSPKDWAKLRSTSGLGGLRESAGTPSSEVKRLLMGAMCWKFPIPMSENWWETC